MKTQLFLFALSFAALNLFGQTQETTPKDPKAKAILDKLSAKTKAYTTIDAEFEYKLVNERDGIDETQKGKVIIQGEKYKLNIAGQEIISDGKTLYTFIPDAKELQISAVDNSGANEDDLFGSPSKIFTLYEKGFKYVYEGTSSYMGTTVDLIKLYPENPSKTNYHTVKLYIDQAKSEIKAIEIMAKDGNKYTYNLIKFTGNANVPANTFTFDQSRAADVIDLR